MPVKEDISGSLILPKWFIGAATTVMGIATAIMLAAIPWAWSIQATLTEVKTELRIGNQATKEKFEGIYKRLDRLEGVRR